MKINSLIICVLLFIGYSCNDIEPKKKPVKINKVKEDSAVEAEIKNILATTSLNRSTYNNQERIDFILRQPDLNTSGTLVFQLAKENLNAGNSEKALELIKNMIENIPGLKEINPNSLMLHKFEAICYLRIAEQKNCQENHNEQSCIVPLMEKGVHSISNPAELAKKKYSDILDKFPNDFESKWLMNITYMALDQYPDQVPSNHLINISFPYRLEKFINVATAMSIDEFDLSGGVIADDFNNDGHIDLIISSWSKNGRIKYFKNKGDGSFEDLTVSSGLSIITGGLNLKQADYNNDGNLDFIVLRGGWVPRTDWGVLPNTLLRNNGDNTFSDVTMETGIYSVNPTQSAEWFDYNNDGWIDIFIANETTGSSDKNFNCELYLNDNGNFKNVASELNVDLAGYFKGVNSGDINNDGFPDLYLSNLKGENELLLNIEREGKRSFDRIASKTATTEPYSAFPNWFFDVNNDGWEDIYVASYDSTAFSDQSGQFARDQLNVPVLCEMNRIYINRGQLNFTEESKTYIPSMALSTMGCNYGDTNNDGFPDYYLGTGSPDYRSIVPNRFFLNQGGTSFIEKTFAFGLGHIQKGHAIAFVDIDYDGYQDIYANMGGAFQGDKFPNALFMNPGGSNDWLKLKLEGSKSNKYAIGARIRVGLTKSDDDQIVYKYSKISSGASFGANPLLAHIGLEQGYEIQSIEINWPNAENIWITYDGIHKNGYYLIKEIDHSVSELNHEKVNLQLNAPGAHHHH